MTSRTRWFASLSPERRARIRALYKPRPAWNSVVFAFLTIWFVGAAMAFHASWVVRIPLYVVMGASLHAIGILMHEAVHGNFLRNRRWDRVAAFVLGIPILVSGTAYRVTHLLHHRHTRGGRDPDELANYVRHPKLLSVAFYAWLLSGMAAFLVHVPVQALRHGNTAERHAVILEMLGIVFTWSAVVYTAVWMGAGGVLIHGWLLPLLVTFVIVNVRGWSEHLLTVPGNPMTETRTIVSNRVVRFFLLNLNYHLEHHLCPGIPWYNVPRLHAELHDDYRRAGAFVQRSYLAFMCDAFRTGIHGHCPRQTRNEVGHE